MNPSHDPRVKRLGVAEMDGKAITTNTHWVTWEVFHQAKRGKEPVHVGIVHASSPEMAVVLAKEQYGRRSKTTNLWVVKSSDIFALDADEEEMFATVKDKTFREPGAYKVRDRIEAYKKANGL